MPASAPRANRAAGRRIERDHADRADQRDQEDQPPRQLGQRLGNDRRGDHALRPGAAGLGRGLDLRLAARGALGQRSAPLLFERGKRLPSPFAGRTDRSCTSLARPAPRRAAAEAAMLDDHRSAKRGSSAGAKETNSAWSRSAQFDRSGRAGCRDPEHLGGAGLAGHLDARERQLRLPPPVPSPLTTSDMPPRTISRCSGSTSSIGRRLRLSAISRRGWSSFARRHPRRHHRQLHRVDQHDIPGRSTR